MRCIILCYLLILALPLSGQVADWRIGFEYNETDPGLFGITEQTHDSLLSRLGEVTRSQAVRGVVNINSIGGGWEGMQSGPTAAINFNSTDNWVRRLQRNGFGLVWNLEPNARWSFAQNPDCITPPLFQITECAPDSLHWQHWYDYVHAIVERYDGDGTADMPGLVLPVRYYVMEQEAYFGGAANGIAGDSGEVRGYGYWEDNVHNLLRLHEVAYQALRDADPSGNTKLIGSGGLLFDLYGDFPDYPDPDGPVVQARLAGNNLMGADYRHGWDSLKTLLRGLAVDTPLRRCDYIGWHPHLGWKSTDQCLRLIRQEASGKPVFLDDMWSAMLTTTLPNGGFTQFIGGDSLERDFPNATVGSYTALINGLDAGNSTVTDWYNAHTAREIVKCFSLCFGEGVERASCSMANDANPNHTLLWPFTGPYRYTGLHASAPNGFAAKPAAYALQLLCDQLHDFTSASPLVVSADPYTRAYRFERQRGTACVVAWSESAQDPADPHLPNGESVSIGFATDSIILHHPVVTAGTTVHDSTVMGLTARTWNGTLGFEPVLLEEIGGSTGIGELTQPRLLLAPNPAQEVVRVSSSNNAMIRTMTLTGADGRAISLPAGISGEGNGLLLPLGGIPDGIYLLRAIQQNGETIQRRLVILH